MAEIANLNGVNIRFEIHGEGIPIVYTPGSVWGLEHGRLLAEPLVEAGYQVLIHDRPNCGASDIVVEAYPNEFDVWASYLHALMQRLEMSPIYMCGQSGGALLSLLMMHRYPKAVSGLFLLSPPTDNSEFWHYVGERYRVGAELADRKGMLAVTEVMPWSELIEQNPANRERLLSMDSRNFATMMKQWSSWMTLGRAHVAGLSDEQLRDITTHTMIVSGLRKDHPRQAAENLHHLLPHSELVLPSEYFSPDEMERILDEANPSGDQEYWAGMAALLNKFIQRVEAARN